MEKDLGLIVLNSMSNRGKDIEKELKYLRSDNSDLIIPIKQSRFGNGEGKIEICESVKEKDIYILSDISNYNVTYKMPNGIINHSSPDDHFRDIQRAIIASRDHAKRITVIMPLLYSSRQHRRKKRESLDCACALQELKSFYGVKSIVTFDVHSQDINNSLPLNSFENIYTSGLILKDFLKKELNNLDIDNMVVISPDTGAIDRTRFYSNVFKAPLGLFYKQRDYTTVTDGKNRIISHDYAGPEIEGKDVLVIDDMISSGDSSLDVAEQLTAKGAKNIYFIVSFALFVNGIDNFNKAYNEGKFRKLYTTNFSYIPNEYKNESWLEIVDGSELLARVINTMNYNKSMEPFIDEKTEVADYVKTMKLTLK